MPSTPETLRDGLHAINGDWMMDVETCFEKARKAPGYTTFELALVCLAHHYADLLEQQAGPSLRREPLHEAAAPTASLGNRDEQGRWRIQLLEGWQDGPASVTFYADELTLDDGTVGLGVIFEISTPTDPAPTPMTIELGTGGLEFPPGKGRLKFWVAGSREQATALRDGLTALLDEMRP